MFFWWCHPKRRGSVFCCSLERYLEKNIGYMLFQPKLIVYQVCFVSSWCQVLVTRLFVVIVTLPVVDVAPMWCDFYVPWESNPVPGTGLMIPISQSMILWYNAFLGDRFSKMVFLGNIFEFSCFFSSDRLIPQCYDLMHIFRIQMKIVTTIVMTWV